MVELARSIAEYADSLRFEDLSPEVVWAAKLRVLDSIGCALGALDAPPVEIAREVASLGTSSYSATPFGLWKKVAALDAAFANGCAIRYLDFNDTSLGRGECHSSDSLAAILATAEAEGAGGKEVILATVLAYDIARKMTEAAGRDFFNRGWDMTSLWIAPAAAVGVGKLMGLDVDKMTQTINIAVFRAISTLQSRFGEISYWKAANAAFVANTAMFGAMLARRGMTGPANVFEGKFGLFNMVTVEFVIDLDKDSYGHGVLETTPKEYPVQGFCQNLIQAAINLREKIGQKEIKEIQIDLPRKLHFHLAGSPERWSPKEQRETADHSAPWIVARTLLDGTLWVDSFSDAKISDPKAADLIKKMKVSIDPKLNKMYEEVGALLSPCRVTITTEDGATFVEELIYRKGHPQNPISDDEIKQKYLRLGGTESSMRKILDLEKYDVDSVLSSLQQKPGEM